MARAARVPGCYRRRGGPQSLSEVAGYFGLGRSGGDANPEEEKRGESRFAVGYPDEGFN